VSTTFKALYGTSNQSITCTIDALTNNSARQSTAVDNTTNLYLEGLVAVKIVSGASATSTSGTVNVYAYGTVDGGTTYTEGASGTDGALTLVNPTNLRLIGVINVVANSTTYRGGPFAVANAFGGVLPDHWGVVVENKSGGTLGTGCAVVYQGVWTQGV
jgi:hypothetical protein